MVAFWTTRTHLDACARSPAAWEPPLLKYFEQYEFLRCCCCILTDGDFMWQWAFRPWRVLAMPSTLYCCVCSCPRPSSRYTTSIAYAFFIDLAGQVPVIASTARAAWPAAVNIRLCCISRTRRGTQACPVQVPVCSSRRRQYCLCPVLRFRLGFKSVFPQKHKCPLPTGSQVHCAATQIHLRCTLMATSCVNKDIQMYDRPFCGTIPDPCGAVQVPNISLPKIVSDRTYTWQTT